MQIQLSVKKIRLKSAQWFMLSALFVNAGNYLYNLILGRLLGPSQFADAALLITFLMLLSFIAMTFQLSLAKFTAAAEDHEVPLLWHFIRKYALWTGIIIGILILLWAPQFQSWFNTQSLWMFYLLGLGVPLYFLMSVNRGYYQGRTDFLKLSATYQTEMLSRLILSVLLVLIWRENTAILVAIGILLSLGFALVPFPRLPKINQALTYSLAPEKKKAIRLFVGITAFYELSQIIINNSDILLVKHYFKAYEAGLYASMALIGRMVYFVAWMLVMVLLPRVVQLEKQQVNSLPLFLKYLAGISLLVFCIVLGAYFFPNTLVQLLFGEAYTSIAPLLWKYALATALFTLANVFVYYFLSLGQYLPVLLSALLGLAQVGSLIFFHHSLEQVVEVQIICMALLCLMQVLLFFYLKNRNIGLSKCPIHRRIKE